MSVLTVSGGDYLQEGSYLEAKGLNRPVKKVGEFVLSRLVAGALVVAPIYLASLLLLKAMKSMMGLVKPLAKLVPPSLPAAQLLSLMFLLMACFLIGLGVRTPMGRSTRERIEKSLFRRMPGYGLLRSLTQRLTGEGQESTWKPALAEIEEALVPAFIIEELENGYFTVFVPSVPTPLAGSVYILSPDRVHPLDIPFTQAIKTISKWGEGSKDLVAAMKSKQPR